jgi:3-phosphoshikimate 1-carboxyvinyltransferase
METEPGRISVSRSELKGIEIDVPGDFSSAAFFIAAALLVPGSLLRIRDVGVNPTRTGMLGVLEEMGAEITIENPRSWGGEPVADLIVESVSGLRGIDVGEARIPSLVDELPVLFVLASFAEGTSRFTGARELRVKESDRIAVMTRELRKLGVEVEELADGVVIRGGNRFRGARFSSDGDHRVAMSFAIAALAADGESRIDGTECIRTSFPGFEKLLKSVCRS